MNLRTLLTLSAFVISLFSMARQPGIQFSDKVKAPSDVTTFSRIIGADETGIYTMQQFLKKSVIMTRGQMGLSMQLCRYNDQFKPVYENIFYTDKELEQRTVENVILLHNNLYVFTSEYSRKEKSYELCAVKINKLTGKIAGPWTVVGYFSKEKERDDFTYAVTLSADSSCFVMAGNITSANSTYQVRLLDTDLHKIATVGFSYDLNAYDLDAVVYAQNKVLIAGKEFEPAKRKSKRKFKKAVLFVYNTDGKRESDISVNKDGMYATSMNLYPFRDKVLLTGFYSHNLKKTELNGVFVYTIDPATGTLSQGDTKELTTDMIGKTFDEDDEKDSKKIEKEIEEDGEGFSDHYVFTKAVPDPASQSLILFAEYQRYRESFSHSNTTTAGNPGGGMSFNSRQYFFISGNIIAMKISADARLSWVNMLPKNQVEIIDLRSVNGNSPGSPGFYSAPGPGAFFHVIQLLPFFSSFNCLQDGKKFGLVLNDHSVNSHVVSANDKTKKIINLYKSDFFYVRMDLATGKFSRRYLFSNKGEPTAMPRFGTVIGNRLYMPAIKFKFLAKPDSRLISVDLDKL